MRQHRYDHVPRCCLQICNQPSESSTWIAITIWPPEHPTNPLTQFIVLRETYGKVQKNIDA